MKNSLVLKIQKNKKKEIKIRVLKKKTKWMTAVVQKVTCMIALASKIKNKKINKL